MRVEVAQTGPGPVSNSTSVPVLWYANICQLPGAPLGSRSSGRSSMAFQPKLGGGTRLQHRKSLRPSGCELGLRKPPAADGGAVVVGHGIQT